MVRTQRRFLLVTGLAAACWLVLAWLIVPAAIRQAHAGESIDLFNRLLESRAHKPVHLLLDRWRSVASWGGYVLLLAPALLLTWPQVQKYADRLSSVLGRAAPWVINCAVVLVGGAVVIFLLYEKPVLFVHVINENWWAEYGTFCAYLLAALFFGWAFVVGARSRRLGVVLLSLASLFLAFEEIKWGQDVLGLEPPDIFMQKNAQGQITLHNMVRMPTHAATGLGVLLLAIGLPLAAGRVSTLKRLCAKWGIPLVPPYIWPFFIAAGLALSAPPTMMYLKFDEIAELALSVAVLALALHVCLAGVEGTAPPSRVGYTFALGGVLLVLAGASIGLTAAVPSSMTWRLNDFAANRFPSAGMERQATALFEYLEGHPEVQSSDTYVRWAEFLSQGGRGVESQPVLNRALSVQDSLLRDQPSDPELHRNRFQILRYLGRDVEAEEAFDTAIQLDLRSLEETRDPTERARVHLSLAQTLAQAGRQAEAMDHVRDACKLAPPAPTVRAIHNWHRQTWPDAPLPPGCPGRR